VRVVQRNLVYVIGLPPAIALEETLRRPEYFGQYGRIVKVRACVVCVVCVVCVTCVRDETTRSEEMLWP
jgi:hypothetical protein